jgi:hypothetical protein
VQGTALGGTDSNVKLNGVTNGQIISYDGGNGYWKNTDLTAGTAISVAKSANGVLTVNNTGVTSAVAGTGISVSGATGAVTVTNSAPDQTVVLTAGTGISTSGTYPNFTITNTSPSSGGTVTSVTGTSPVVSSGGATPAISMPAATGSVNGYLTSTDWTTFNSKQATLVSGTNIKTVSGTSLLGAGDLGTIGATYGGTSQSTYATGDILYASASNTLSKLSVGTTGQVLTVASGAPSWAAASSSNITALGLYENSATISANYTIGTGNNAMSAGPITVNTGVTVTVPTGSTWVIV